MENKDHILLFRVSKSELEHIEQKKAEVRCLSDEEKSLTSGVARQNTEEAYQQKVLPDQRFGGILSI